MMKKINFTIFLGILFFVFGLFIFSQHAAAASSSQAEIEWGQRICKDVEAQVPLLKDEKIQQRVKTIGLKVAAVVPRRDLPYTFKVLDNPEVNAFAVPGGFIYVCKGLLTALPSDDEVAGVLAHELGHIQKKHSIKQSDQSLGLAALFLLLLGDRGLPLQSIAQQAIMAGYSRTDEREADQLGLQYSMQAGYNPYGILLTMEKLATMEQPYHYDLFADHPEAKERIQLIRQGMKQAGIRPDVIDGDQESLVIDQAKVLLRFNRPSNGRTAHERAYDAAGKLFSLLHKKDLSSDHLYIKQEEEMLKLCYDDTELVQFTPEDGAYGNLQIEDQATEALNQIKSLLP